MGGGFLRSLVWSMSGSDTRVETHGQGTTQTTPTFMKKNIVTGCITSKENSFNKLVRHGFWQFIKALLHMMYIRLSPTFLTLLFFPAALRAGSGWLCGLSALSVTLSESKCEGISWNPPVLQQHQPRPLHVSISVSDYKHCSIIQACISRFLELSW